jgi:hypothetical protein
MKAVIFLLPFLCDPARGSDTAYVAPNAVVATVAVTTIVVAVVAFVMQSSISFYLK